MTFKVVTKLIASIVALAIFLTQHRLGISVVSFLMIIIILKEGVKFNIKMLTNAILGVMLFAIGYFLSVKTVSLYYHLLGIKTFTFMGGFFGGIIEMGTFLLFGLLTFSFLVDKNSKGLIRYIVISIMVSVLIGGLAQGSYNEGWQNIFYV